jgi:hypothetical protein
MPGLGDEVVTRCASCGYALTARRYAVPRECPICRASLDSEFDRTPRDAAESQAETQPAETSMPDDSPAVAAETTSMGVSESDSARAREPVHTQSAAHEPEAEGTPSSSPSSTPGETETQARDAGGPSRPSFGEATNATPPAVVTSPLGSVTSPMLGSDTHAAARADGPSGQPRATVAYTPLDAGELWSEFGGASPPRAEPRTGSAPAQHPESKAHADTKNEPAPPSLQSSPAFPQSSPLGLSGAADAQQPRHAHAQVASQAAPPPFTMHAAAPAQVQPIGAPHTRGPFESSVAPRVMSRYADAYRVARATAAVGTAIKVSGALLGLLIGFGLFLAVDALGQGPRGGLIGLLLGLFFGVATFALFYVLGVVLSSFGQLKKSALDSAVNTSPFLTNEQRAEVMSLR